MGSANKGGTAADNHLTVDFGLAKDISQIKVQVSSSHHDCPKLRILASNDPSFNTFQVFGEIDNINILDQTELTVNAGQKITVLEGEGWQFQFNGELPFELKENMIFKIPEGMYHRLIKGKTDLVLKIKK